MTSFDFSRPPAARPKQQEGEVISSEELMQQLSNRTQGVPVPVGTPIIVKRATAGEKRWLTSLGWDGKAPVSSEVLKIIEAVKREATDLDSMPLPAGLRADSPPLKDPGYIALDKLPPDRQKHYRKIFEEVNEEMIAAEAQREALSRGQIQPSVAETIRQASGQSVTRLDEESDKNFMSPFIPNDDEPASPAPPPVTKAREAAPEPESTSDKPKSDEQATGLEQTPEEYLSALHKAAAPFIEQDDYWRYYEYLLGGAYFSKSFLLLDGHLRITVRTLEMEEFDEITQQVRRDVSLQRYHADMWGEWVSRYQTAVSLVALESTRGACTPVFCALSLDNWHQHLGDERNDLVYNIFKTLRKAIPSSDTMSLCSMASTRFSVVTNYLRSLGAAGHFFAQAGDTNS